MGWFRPLVSTGDQPIFPTLFMLICFLVLTCWILTFLAFFFDKYRVPMVILLSLLLYFSAWLTRQDHFFSARSLPYPLHSLQPADVLSGRMTPANAALAGKLIVVSATGGGIQAAAWTATVLNGITEVCETLAGSDCHRMIRAISAVSGGSVGAMYFLAAYDPASGSLPSPAARKAAVLDNATASSLEDVAWGLVYPDFTKVLVPVPLLWPGFVRQDRGYLLQQSWVRVPPLTSATIGRWREDVRKGTRPAAFFNATTVETGRQLIMGTANVEPDGVQNPTEGYREFGSAYGANVDLTIPTAVRLSATFPYVTDAARIDLRDCESCSHHVADGGYYDNFGLNTLLTWLDHALEGQTAISDVMIVQIRSSPQDLGASARAGTQLPFFGSVALSTMLSVWNTSQAARNDSMLRFLTDKWKARLPRVDLHTAIFQYGECSRAQYLENPELNLDATTPLSWHLTARDKAVIADEWKRCSGQQGPAPEMDKVRQFLTSQRKE